VSSGREVMGSSSGSSLMMMLDREGRDERTGSLRTARELR
jgi:hypothetical protein